MLGVVGFVAVAWCFGVFALVIVGLTGLVRYVGVVKLRCVIVGWCWGRFVVATIVCVV